MRKFVSRLQPYFFILPTLMLFGLILLIPMGNMIIYSLGESTIFGGFVKWNGGSNYAYLTSSRFLGAVWVTVQWLLFGVLGVVVCGVSVGLLLDRPIPGRSIFRALVIIPWIVPQAFAASMWSWVLNPQYGFINEFLLATHLVSQPVTFLSVGSALPTVIVVRVWQGAPFLIMTTLAALQTVPRDTLEAAEVDGAGPVARFFHVVLPHIRPVLTVSTLIVAAWTLQIFDTVFIMTNGGPARATQLVALEIYTKAFVESNLGIASAIGLTTLVTIVALAWPVIRKQAEV